MSEPKTPGQIAQELTGRDYVSYSAISTFRQCPLRYYFKYVAGLPEETVAASLVFGGAIHAAAEYHFRELLTGSHPTVEHLFEVYLDAWQQRPPAEILLGKSETAGGLHRLAKRMLECFVVSSFAAPEGAIIGIEEELRGAVVPGCPDLLARVDLIVETQRELIVTDLKTARSRWSGGQVTSSAEQLLLYSELARKLVPAKMLRLKFLVVTKSGVPTVEQHDVRVRQQELDLTKAVVQRVWQAIEGGNFYSSPSPLHCPTCPYRRECRAWSG